MPVRLPPGARTPLSATAYSYDATAIDPQLPAAVVTPLFFTVQVKFQTHAGVPLFHVVGGVGGSRVFRRPAAADRRHGDGNDARFGSARETHEIAERRIPAKIRDAPTLPSREEFIAKLLGTMLNPLTGFARVLNGPVEAFARTVQAVADQKAAA